MIFWMSQTFIVPEQNPKQIEVDMQLQHSIFLDDVLCRKSRFYFVFTESGHFTCIFCNFQSIIIIKKDLMEAESSFTEEIVSSRVENSQEGAICRICFGVPVEKVRCKGPCRNIFCLGCVSDWRRTQKDKCIFACSTPFLVELVNEDNSSFNCPFNPQQCTIPLNSIADFRSHHLNCRYTLRQVKQESNSNSLNRFYKCQKGHQLYLLIGSYEEMTQYRCKQCKMNRTCRSICRICEEAYCVICRVPPCSKKGCLIGHKYTYYTIESLDYVCDICGNSTSIINQGVYDDPQCNFGICQRCYQKLPEELDPLNVCLKININTKCSCGTSLIEIDSVNSAYICDICKSSKECPKKCSRCQKFYCLKCKMMDIGTDEKCGKYNHKLYKVDLSTRYSTVQLQNQQGCMRCLAKENQYYFDKLCRVRLCQKCFKYFMKVTSDRQRCRIVKCEMNHALRYIIGQSDFYDICSICRVQKIIKLRCPGCREERNGQKEEKNYCFQCRPLKLDTCYFSHELSYKQFKSERQCHFCCKNNRFFHFCRKCFFFVCDDCMTNNMKQFSGEMFLEQEEKPEKKLCEAMVEEQKIQGDINSQSNQS